MRLVNDNVFSHIPHQEKSQVFELFPDIHSDKRGNFSEVLKDMGKWHWNSEYPLWFSNVNWIRQINRSNSVENVVRGCHAQRGRFCQGKLVESVHGKFFDVITDMRPDSETFGISNIYLLDSRIQNKVWVPRGFLHAFVSCKTDSEGEMNTFNYYVDNTYDKESEICVNPSTLLPRIIGELGNLEKSRYSGCEEFEDLVKLFEKDAAIYSDKDKNGICYEEFAKEVKNGYNISGAKWYE